MIHNTNNNKLEIMQPMKNMIYTPTMKNIIYTPGVYNPPVNEDYCEMEATISHELMKHVIGLKGVNFIKITEFSGMKYIWYDNQRNVVEIWGPQIHHTIAKQLLQKKIDIVQEEFNRPSFEKKYLDNVMSSNKVVNRNNINKDWNEIASICDISNIHNDFENYPEMLQFGMDDNEQVCDSYDYYMNEVDTGYDSF